jgi:hypothetical protein
VLGDSKTDALRPVVFAATAALLRGLQDAGARHPDLNLGNVLIVADGTGEHRAFVLDIDRVVFGTPGDPRIGAANVRRLVRSARKLIAHGRIVLTDDELASLARAAGHDA